MNKEVQDILAQEGYSSSEDFARDMSICIALARKEQYKAECEFFERKYGMSLGQLEQILHTLRNVEDFNKEEDLEDWGFASAALRWWEGKLGDMQGVKTP